MRIKREHIPILIAIVLLITWFGVQGSLFLFSPGIGGVNSVDRVIDVENLIRSETESYLKTADDIREFEKLPGVSCSQIWSGVGEIGTNLEGEISPGHAYEIGCTLPRFWVRSGGIWNLVVPLKIYAGFRFKEENDELVWISTMTSGGGGYFAGVFYD